MSLTELHDEFINARLSITGHVLDGSDMAANKSARLVQGLVYR